MDVYDENYNIIEGRKTYLKYTKYTNYTHYITSNRISGVLRTL